MPIDGERLQLTIEKVAKKLELKQWRYVKNEIDKNVKHYFGVLVPVKVIGVDKNGEMEKSFFIKFSPTAVDQKLQRDVQILFEIESFTYCQMLPIYKRYTSVNLQFIPKCYYSDSELNNAFIVMQDMRSEGYRRCKTNRFIDSDHVRLSLETLAKFHTLSSILKEKNISFDNTIIKPYTDKSLDFYYDCVKNSLKSHIDLFKNSIYENYLRTLIKDLRVFVNTSSSEVKYLVFGHGDFQKENILFKYENSKPAQACLLDFQRSRIMSPAHDILMFLLTNTKDNDTIQHQEYLNIYLDTFRLTLNDNDLEDVYSVDDLKYDMKIIAPFCVALTLFAFSMWFGLSDVLGNIIVAKSSTKKDNDNNLSSFKNTITNVLDQLKNLEYIEF